MINGHFILSFFLVKTVQRKKLERQKSLNSAAAFKLSYEKAVCFLEPSTNLQLFLHLPISLAKFLNYDEI